MSESNKETQQHHYVAIDCLGWAHDDSPFKALMSRLEDSKHLHQPLTIWFIPSFKQGRYKINNYVPQVSGAYLWGQFNITKKKDIVKLKLENLDLILDSPKELIKKEFDNYNAGLITINELIIKLTAFDKKQ